MSEGKGTGTNEAADLADLARRFQDLWQEQMAATAADPEFMEMVGKWMGAFTAGGMGPAGAKPPAMPPTGPAGLPGPMDPAAWMAALQAAMAGVAAAGKGGTDERSERGAVPPQAGAKAAAAASGAGDAAGDRLERRIAALEQRLERLEAAIGKPGGGAARRTRRGKS